MGPTQIASLHTHLTNCLDNLGMQKHVEAIKKHVEGTTTIPNGDTAEWKAISDGARNADVTKRGTFRFMEAAFAGLIKALPEHTPHLRLFITPAFNNNPLLCMGKLLQLHPASDHSARQAIVNEMRPHNIKEVLPPTGEESTHDAMRQ